MISIVIINYNGKEYLKDCLGSIAKSTYRDFEVILVDNNSKDGSVSFVEKYFPWVKIIKNKVNVGIAEGCNIGTKYSNGKYVVFFNTDVKVEHNWLEELVRTVESDPSVGACGCKVLRMDAKSIDCIGGFVCDIFGSGLYALGHLEEDRGQYDNVTECFALAGMCMLVRRDVFEIIGGFDSKFFLLVEDIDLCWRIRLAGYDIRVNPHAVVYHKSKATLKKEKIKRDYIRFLVERNTLRMLIKNYSTKSLIRILPKYFAIILAESIFYIFITKIRWTISNMKAILWNIKNLRDSLALHAYINATVRSVDDTDIQKKMLKNSLKIALWTKLYIKVFIQKSSDDEY
jgi:hypothetical protein